MSTTSQPPTHRTTSMEEAGRACPYCHFPLKQGAGVVSCGACSAPHHEDCWRENGGCSVMGCAGANDAALGAQAPPLTMPVPIPPTGMPMPGSLPMPTATMASPPPFATPGQAPAPPPWPQYGAPPTAPIGIPPQTVPLQGGMTPPPRHGVPPAGNARMLPNGATIKLRDPWAVLGLTIVTLGIYPAVWWYMVNREMRDLGRARGAVGLGDNPGLSLAAYLFGGFTLGIATLITIVTTCQRIRRAQALAGSASRLDGWVTGLLWVVTLGLGAIPYMQSQLNTAWRAHFNEPEPAGSSSNSPALAIAVVVLALAVAGTATALIATRDDVQTTADTSSSDGTVSPDASTTESAEAAPEDTPEPEPVDTNGVLPNVSESTMEADIEDVLLEHHQAIADRDFSAAWGLMSERKQRQKAAEEGVSKWSQGQREYLSDYLDPSDIDVSIRSENERTGVATIDVTGMAYSRPGSSCSTWSGVTWAKYENDAWRYEPGYGVTSQRKRQWESRYSELMGVGC